MFLPYVLLFFWEVSGFPGAHEDLLVFELDHLDQFVPGHP
jgi:hypothetical protein